MDESKGQQLDNWNNPRGLDPQEQEVLTRLSDAFRLFYALPVLHPSDTVDFHAAIHAAQRVVMARPFVIRKSGGME